MMHERVRVVFWGAFTSQAALLGSKILAWLHEALLSVHYLYFSLLRHDTLVTSSLGAIDILGYSRETIFANLTSTRRAERRRNAAPLCPTL